MTSDIVNREFRQFGDKIYYMMIFFILSFIIPIIPSIVMLYFSISILGDTKRANRELNKSELANFRSYFISSYVLTFVVMIVLIIVGILLIIALLPLMESLMVLIETEVEPTLSQILEIFDEILPLLIILGLIVIICMIVVFIASILRYLAWGQLNEFFIKNSGLFPEAIAQDAQRGAKNLKMAGLCLILGFLVITIIIGLIYEIMGYIKLAKLRNLPYSTVETVSQPIKVQSIRNGVGGTFCMYCGAKKEEGAMFCANCGQKV